MLKLNYFIFLINFILINFNIYEVSAQIKEETCLSSNDIKGCGPNILEWSNKEFNKRINEEFAAECRIESAEEINAFWIFKNETLSNENDDRITIKNNIERSDNSAKKIYVSQLIIEKLRLQDNGTYICKGEYNSNHVEDSIDLIVKDSSIFGNILAFLALIIWFIMELLSLLMTFLLALLALLIKLAFLALLLFIIIGSIKYFKGKKGKEQKNKSKEEKKSSERSANKNSKSENTTPAKISVKIGVQQKVSQSAQQSPLATATIASAKETAKISLTEKKVNSDIKDSTSTTQPPQPEATSTNTDNTSNRKPKEADSSNSTKSEPKKKGPAKFTSDKNNESTAEKIAGPTISTVATTTTKAAKYLKPMFQSSKQLKNVAALSGTAKPLSGAAGKALMPVAMLIDANRTAKSFVKDVKNGTSRNTVETVASVASGWGGGYGGAVGGAAIGSAIFPGVGTIIGGFVGGLSGGLGASYVTQKVTETIADECEYDIETKKCYDCGRTFKIKKYLNEDVIRCSCGCENFY